ncbi:hypothetical protein OPT61_g75 [Boeremia exigua]|uniref:Uncharacterized protein n=1 Tax=Boeremia exigua TaxID=749465 RepID=A0ACC2IV38_9PLEO|nr:hypothetical protein OPT61_g75 [Boeremia exigua]
MASLLALSAELKLSIIEQLGLASTSFIPAPSPDIISLSRVCKVFRVLSLPYLLKDITLLNDEKSGSSVSSILNSPYAEHVRTLHYIGIMPMAPDPSLEKEEPIRQPSPEDLPESTEHVLSNLAKFVNLEQLIVEFRCGKTEEEDKEIYRDTYDIYKELEGHEKVLEAEKTDAFRSLNKRTYDAITQNSPSTIQSLELRNVVVELCSTWDSPAFKELLEDLSAFSISLRGGDNGAGWQINRVQAYINFVERFHTLFFEHMSNLKHLRISATTDGPPGLDGGMNNAALQLREDNLPNLETLELEYVFISKDLAAFIVAHASSLTTVRLRHCYSGLDENNCAEEVAISWGEFFTIIASANLSRLRVFEVGPSDLETKQPSAPSEYGHDQAVRAKELREKFPGRRMLDYKTVDDKYGMLFDGEGFDHFEEGTDHAGWERLCEVLKQGSGLDTSPE